MTRQIYHRRVIRIRAEDSPNVRLAMAEIAAGKEPSHTILVPGVLPYREYDTRRRLWDPIKQCISLDAQFYEGAELLLYPPDWLNRAEQVAERNKGLRKREAKALGVDCAEGGDDTSIAVVDEYGLLALKSMKTPDTRVIQGEVIAMGRAWGVPSDKWMFDRGGGGQVIADYMRDAGFAVRTVGFGEGVIALPRRGLTPISERILLQEQRYTYVNRRAQMYGELHNLLDPINEEGWGIGIEFSELRRQLAPIPKLYDNEGRLYLPPKKRKPGSKEPSLEEMIGRSPDDADAVVVAVHCMLHAKPTVTVGAI